MTDKIEGRFLARPARSGWLGRALGATCAAPIGLASPAWCDVQLDVSLIVAPTAPLARFKLTTPTAAQTFVQKFLANVAPGAQLGPLGQSSLFQKAGLTAPDTLIGA